MEKILFIAYQFPPRGGPGVHRSLNFVKYLREFGYEPIVLTICKEDIKKAGYIYDESLLDDIPKDITIIRTPSYEPTKLIQFFTKIKLYRVVWFLLYGLLWERSVRWAYKTFNEAEEIIKMHGIKLIYTSSSPFSSLILADLLKQKSGVKWVADLRDPFTDAYAWQFPSKLHWYISRKFEKKYFSKPDKLIVNTPATRNLYIKRSLVDEDKIICLTNGF